jgi:tetratricopeptide (TPR) repeat protein
MIKQRLLTVLIILFPLICIACGPSGIGEYNKALGYQTEGKIDLAEHEYKIALQKNPSLAEAHMNLGVIYLTRGWLDGAEKSTERAIEIFESTKKTYIKGSSWAQSLSIAYNNLGIVEIRRAAEAEIKSDKDGAKTHWKTAMSHFSKAVQLDASNSQAQANIKQFQDAY